MLVAVRAGVAARDLRAGFAGAAGTCRSPRSTVIAVTPLRRSTLATASLVAFAADTKLGDRALWFALLSSTRVIDALGPYFATNAGIRWTLSQRWKLLLFQ